MNKKGSFAEVIGAIALIGVVLLVLVALGGSSDNNVFTRLFSNIGWDSLGNAFASMNNFLISAKDVVMSIAVPESAGLDANQEVIALAVFLLMLIIGTHSLNLAFQKPIMSFFIAALISLIASRALSATIINDYIVGSPVAAAAFIVGIIPLFFIYGIMNKWASGKIFVKSIVWCILAVIYFMVFVYSFGSKTLGTVYAIAILIAGIVELIVPYLVYSQKSTTAKSIGKFIRLSHDDLSTWETAYNTAATAGTRKPKAPWEY